MYAQTQEQILLLVGLVNVCAKKIVQWHSRVKCVFGPQEAPVLDSQKKEPASSSDPKTIPRSERVPCSKEELNSQPARDTSNFVLSVSSEGTNGIFLHFDDMRSW